MRITSTLFLMASLIVGCGDTQEGKTPGPIGGKADDPGKTSPIVITKAMNGETVQAKVGDLIEIRLDGNPTTGYQWEAVVQSRSLPVSSSEYIPDEPVLDGSGGTYVFTVKPDTFAEGGTHQFQFAYFRSWEGAENAIETFSVSIAVSKKSSDTIIIDESMNGETVVAKVGETLEIRLAGNPTTGYEWQAVAYSKSLPISSSDYIPDEPVLDGSGGTYVFTIKPDTFAEGGTHQFQLAYFRSWEGAEQAIKTFSVSIKVIAGCEPVMCDLYCKYGFAVDEQTGCAVCSCLDPFACQQDADCGVADADCCGCSMGGTSQAVNKDYIDLVSPAPEQCEIGGQPIMCMAVYLCFGTPVCLNGQCVLQ